PRRGACASCCRTGTYGEAWPWLGCLLFAGALARECDDIEFVERPELDAVALCRQAAGAGPPTDRALGDVKTASDLPDMQRQAGTTSDRNVTHWSLPQRREA